MKEYGKLCLRMCVLLLVVYCAACGDEEDDMASTVDGVEGAWCQQEVTQTSECVANDGGYLEIQQSGSTVTGQHCESFGRDCASINEGMFVDGSLTFNYTIEEESGGEEARVDGTLALNGAMLIGNLFSTKCDCDIPVVYHRIP